MGNNLTVSAVSVTVRKTFRRIATGKLQPNGHAHGGTNGHSIGQHNGNINGAGMENPELAPLLGGASSSERGYRSLSWDLLLNSKETPGTDSPNLFVKYPALVWHVIKVTLLSCKYLSLRAHGEAAPTSAPTLLTYPAALCANVRAF